MINRVRGQGVYCEDNLIELKDKVKLKAFVEDIEGKGCDV